VSAGLTGPGSVVPSRAPPPSPSDGRPPKRDSVCQIWTLMVARRSPAAHTATTSVQTWRSPTRTGAGASRLDADSDMRISTGPSGSSGPGAHPPQTGGTTPGPPSIPTIPGPTTSTSTSRHAQGPDRKPFATATPEAFATATPEAFATARTPAPSDDPLPVRRSTRNGTERARNPGRGCAGLRLSGARHVRGCGTTTQRVRGRPTALADRSGPPLTWATCHVRMSRIDWAE
jgi:hypothetical protein